MGLVEKAEPLHVIPASYPVEEALRLSGTKVLMKAGKKMGRVKEELLKLDEEVTSNRELWDGRGSLLSECP